MRSRGILDQKYIFEYELGHFAFGSCRVLRDRSSDTMRNCKVVPKNMVRSPQSVVERLNQLKSLQGKHIAAVTDVMEDANCIYIISEFCAGGDVGDWMEKLNEDHLLEEQTCAAYVRQAILALSQSHSRNLFHRDLQPQNMLLTSKMPDATVKVSDIGIAPILDPDGAILQRNRRSNPYAAPEVQNGTEAYVSGAPDVWSIGAIAHQLLVGSTPGGRNGGGLDWLFRRNMDDIWEERTDAAHDFVDRLLQQDPNRRATAASALQHPWLKSAAPSNEPDPAPAAPFGGGITGAPVGDGMRDVRNQTLCYTLAVLMVPVLVPQRDFEQLQTVFRSQDTDNDGFNSNAVVQRILLSRCNLSEAVTPALAIADVNKTGSVDLCATAVADLIAREFFAAGPTGQQLSGPFRPADLAPRMLKKFFDVFGENKQNANGSPGVVSANGIGAKLRTATARDMERFAAVSYPDVIGSLPTDRVLDTQALASVLAASGAQGTPAGVRTMSVYASSPLSRGGGYAKSFRDSSAPTFTGGFMDFFQTCTVGPERDESPDTISVEDPSRQRSRRSQ